MILGSLKIYKESCYFMLQSPYKMCLFIYLYRQIHVQCIEVTSLGIIIFSTKVNTLVSCIKSLLLSIWKRKFIVFACYSECKDLLLTTTYSDLIFIFSLILKILGSKIAHFHSQVEVRARDWLIYFLIHRLKPNIYV